MRAAWGPDGNEMISKLLDAGADVNRQDNV